MSKKILFFTLFLWLTAVIVPVFAQEKADTTWTFRFVPQKDMFYVPLDGNDRELARLLECVRRNKDSILGGSLPLYVDGWCNSLDSEKENLRMAAIRANRVKSELITRAEIKEENFITRNHEPCHGKDPCQPCEIRTDYTCGNKRGEFHYPQPCD